MGCGCCTHPGSRWCVKRWWLGFLCSCSSCLGCASNTARGGHCFIRPWERDTICPAAGVVPVEGGGLPVKIKLIQVRECLADGEAAPALMALLLLVANPFAAYPARWRVLLASTLGVVAGTAMTSMLIGGVAFALRYSQPILHVALILTGLYGFFTKRNSLAGLGFLLCLAFFVGNQWQNLTDSIGSLRHYMKQGRYGNLCTERDVQIIRELQSSIPPGKRMLVVLENGFLLDFSRNPIWNFDVPGMVSPPPGMPITDDPDALRAFLTWKKSDKWFDRLDELPPHSSSEKVLSYLRGVGVDFVAFSRGPDSIWYLRRQVVPAQPLWIRNIVTISYMVQRELVALIDKCEVVYDDGDLIVLDLGRSGRPAGQAAATAGLDKKDRPQLRGAMIGR